MAGVFTDLSDNNSIDALDTELESLDTTLTVLKTGHIDLGLFESCTPSNAFPTYNVIEAPIYGYVASGDHVTIYRQFNENVFLNADVPYIARDVRIPMDAAVTTACTIKYVYSGTPYGDYKVNFVMAKRTLGQFHYHNASATTPISLTLPSSRTYYEGIVTTPVVSAGDILQIMFFRDGQTAGDTGTIFAIHGMILEYTKKA
jgi:hypothetical protein